MAGQYARIWRAIWDDDDFRAISPDARLLYIALFSHKKVNACGVLDDRPTRWEAATGLHGDDIECAMAELERHRFIARDTNTGELAIRTYVRHDIANGKPNMLVAAWNAWRTVESRPLRRWLLDHFPPELWGATHAGKGPKAGTSAVPSDALTLRDEPPNSRHYTPTTTFEQPSERPFEQPSELPTQYDVRSTTSAQQRTDVATAVPDHEPVPPGPAAAAAGRPADGKDARAAVLTAAVAEVARRRDTHQRAQTARNPEGWYRSALAGIERELIERQAHELIHAGATAPDLADLIAPTDGPLADVTPLRPGPAPVVDKDRSCFCGGTGWVDLLGQDDDGNLADAPPEVARCPHCNPDPLDAPTPA